MATTEKTKNIFEALAEIMKTVKAIGKDRKNEQQGFKFRGIDDVMNELHEAFAEHNVFIVPEVLERTENERISKSGSALFYIKAKCKFTFFTVDGSNISAITIGEGMDSGDKGTNKAMSIALKYALLQMFLIPTEEAKDPDAETHEVKAAIKKIEPIKTLNEQKATLPVKNIKPVMTEKAFDAAMVRIKSGETGLFKKLLDAMTIKEAYQVQLEKAEADARNEENKKEITENIPAPYEKK